MAGVFRGARLNSIKIMADDNDEMYSDGPDAAPPTETASKQEEGEQTGLLPKSFFGSKELTPGKQCKVEIEKVYEDEVSVRYVSHNEGGTETPAEEAAVNEEDDSMYADA